MAFALPLLFGLLWMGAYESREFGKASDFLPKGACPGYLVRLYAGMSPVGNDENQYAGNIPSITLYDEEGGFLGREHIRKKMGEEEARDFCVKGHGSSRPAAYIALSASDKTDAICLSAIVITQPEGRMNVITGDMPASCNYAHGYSNTRVGRQKPMCMWLDGDYSVSGERPFMQGLSFHIRDFEATEERAFFYSRIPKSLCDSEPRMHRHHKFTSKNKIRVFDPPLSYHTEEGDLDVDYDKVLMEENWAYSDNVPHKRSLIERASEHLNTITSSVSRIFTRAPTASSFQDRFAGRVILTNNTAHSAVKACGDTNFFGPDFVSLQEQIFCDMKARQTYPVCQEGNTSGACFKLGDNEGDNKLISGAPGNGSSTGGSMMAAPVIPATLKEYTVFSRW